MSMMDLGVSETDATHGAAIRMPTINRPLHRLAEVRRLQGVTAPHNSASAEHRCQYGKDSGES